jgi:nucleoside-diphosphate-sugar epimerase
MDSPVTVKRDFLPDVLVTGVSGFIGSHIVRHLAARGYRVRGTARRIERVPLVARTACNELVPLTIDAKTDWTDLVRGVRFVVHAAAHVHVIRPTDSDAALFDAINVKAVEALAETCAKAGAETLINLSSVAAGVGSTAFNPGTYGGSKSCGERVISGVLRDCDCRFVNVRLPAVYGPGMKGALSLLYKWVKLGLPAPLFEPTPKRSYVSIWNVTDCIAHCLSAPVRRSCTVTVADREQLSFRELVTLMRQGLGKSARFVSIDSRSLAVLAKLIRREREFHQVYSDSSVDFDLLESTLAWQPAVPAAKAWRRVALSSNGVAN